MIFQSVTFKHVKTMAFFFFFLEMYQKDIKLLFTDLYTENLINYAFQRKWLQHYLIEHAYL